MLIKIKVKIELSIIRLDILLERLKQALYVVHSESRIAQDAHDFKHWPANLLLSLLQTSLERRWSFSGLATMVRIVMMEYLNMKIFFNMPDADMKRMLEDAAESPPNGEECE